MTPSEYALTRLRRLLRKRKETEGQLNEEGVRLLNRAVYSTYCDAVELGAGDEAKGYLEADVAVS